MPDYFFQYRKSSGRVIRVGVVQDAPPADETLIGVAVDPNYGKGLDGVNLIVAPPRVEDPPGSGRFKCDGTAESWNMPSPAHYDLASDTLRAPTASESARYAAAEIADELSEHKQKLRDGITLRGQTRAILRTLVNMENLRDPSARLTAAQIRSAWQDAANAET